MVFTPYTTCTTLLVVEDILSSCGRVQHPRELGAPLIISTSSHQDILHMSVSLPMDSCVQSMARNFGDILMKIDTLTCCDLRAKAFENGSSLTTFLITSPYNTLF